MKEKLKIKARVTPALVDGGKYQRWAEAFRPEEIKKALEKVEDQIQNLENDLLELHRKRAALKSAQIEYEVTQEEKALLGKFKETFKDPVGFFLKVFGPKEGLKRLNAWKKQESRWTFAAEADCRVLFRTCQNLGFDRFIREPIVIWRLVVASRGYKEL